MSLKPVRITLGINLDRVLFPISFTEIVSSLEKNGFEINKEIPYPRPVGRPIGSGSFGRKGKLVFSVDAGGKSIVISGNSIEESLEELDTFVTTIKTDYSFDLDEYPKYYHFTGKYKYHTNKNAYSIINRFYSNHKNEEISKILDKPLNTFAFKLGSADLVPNDENWFDIQIAPDIERNDGYMIDTVYRNEEKEIYRTFLTHIEENIVKIIQVLEG